MNDVSTRSLLEANTKNEMEGCTDSPIHWVRGATQTSKSKSSTLSRKVTYEDLFYKIVRNGKNAGKIRGFAGIARMGRAQWCTKELKVAPVHLIPPPARKKLTQRLCSISESQQTNQSESSVIRKQASSSRWWKSAGMNPIAGNGVRKTICSLPFIPHLQEADAGSVTIKA